MCVCVCVWCVCVCVWCVVWCVCGLTVSRSSSSRARPSSVSRSAGQNQRVKRVKNLAGQTDRWSKPAGQTRQESYWSNRLRRVEIAGARAGSTPALAVKLKSGQTQKWSNWAAGANETAGQARRAQAHRQSDRSNRSRLNWSNRYGQLVNAELVKPIKAKPVKSIKAALVKPVKHSPRMVAARSAGASPSSWRPGRRSASSRHLRPI